MDRNNQGFITRRIVDFKREITITWYKRVSKKKIIYDLMFKKYLILSISF